MSALTNDFNLNRFITAQDRAYAAALAELRQGRKRSHWIWYILPQLKGLGWSSMSESYGLSGLAEAHAYLTHPVLGPRLVECVNALLAHAGTPAEAILGSIDALKFRSCLTLFACAAPDDPVFAAALNCFYAGEPDPKTLRLLEAAGDL